MGTFYLNQKKNEKHNKSKKIIYLRNEKRPLQLNFMKTIVQSYKASPNLTHFTMLFCVILFLSFEKYDYTLYLFGVQQVH